MARENFGPRVAQVAAVALLIDYVVTVAVQTAAGSAAIVSAFPALSGLPVLGPKILLVISVVAILVMCLMIVTGVIRELTSGLPHAQPGSGAVGIGSHSGLIAIVPSTSWRGPSPTAGRR